MTGRLAGALRALRSGGLVVYPTDTLVGLGARATDRAAVDRLLRAKDRPDGMPVSIALSSLEEAERFASFSAMARRYARQHVPGPVTLLLPPTAWGRRTLTGAVTGPGRAIGIRVPDHPVARELAREVGPITCTSANRHGDPPVTTLAQARREFGRSVDVYLPLVPPPSGHPSALVDLTGAEPRIIERRARPAP